MKKNILLSFAVALVLLSACGNQNSIGESPADGSGRLRVVATTSIVADVVTQVGNGLIDVKTLLPAGTDPHSYSPTPQDAALLSDADLIFANGAGLETFLSGLLESTGAAGKLIEVSQGIELLNALEEDHAGESEEAHAEEDDHGHEGDPHTWTDPNNVMVWTENIRAGLSEADPANAAAYQTNADAYRAQLADLDAWIRAQVALIPEEKRNLVTDHMEQGYFAEEYGLRLVGALIPGYSTVSEPSAKELAEIEDAIAELGVKAVFVGNTISPSLAERVAADTGTRLVYIYSGSLSPAGGEAATYLDYMRYNVNAITGALK